MRMQVFIIACLVTSVIATMMIQVTTEMEQNYNVPYSALTNDTAIGQAISNLTFYGTAQDVAVNASSYVPGQPNSLVIDSSNAASSIQQSSFTSALKFIGFGLTFPKLLILTFGNFMGINSLWLNMVATGLNIAILLFLAGIVFFRPF